MKKVLYLLVFLVVLAGVAVVALPHFVTPERIKAELTQRVEEATGRKLTIGGKLEFKVFPFLGVEAEQVSLSNPAKGFDDKPFASIGAMQVSVALLPLLHQDIQVKSFVLKDPVIRLEVNGAGKQNWDFAPAEAEKGAEPKPAEAKEAKSGGFAPKNISLSDIEISNGTLFYLDAKSNTAQKLEQLNAKLNLRSMSAPLDVKADALWQGKKVNVALNLDSLGTFSAGKASQFAANIASDVVSVDAKGTLEGDKVKAKAVVKSSSLKAVAAWANPKSAPIATPAKLALDTAADVACENKACALSNLTLALDAIKAEGDAKLNFGGAVPKLALNVKTGMLDVNPFMGAEKSANLLPGLIADAQAAAGHWSTEAIDLSGLKAAELDVTAAVEGILFRQFKIGATKLKAGLHGGSLQADVTDAALYDGKGSISLTANGAAQPASFALTAALKDIALEPLLSDAADMNRLSGKADITFASNARGRSQAEIISSLAGSGKFNVADGKIQRVNLLDIMHNVSAAISGANAQGQTTAFSDMSGSFTISNGIITNNDLLIAMQGVRVNGQGNVNLPAYTINYRLAPQTYSTKQDATGKATERAGVQVPVLIAGSLDNPSFQPDVQGVLQNALSNPEQFKEQLKNSRGDIKDQLKNGKASLKDLKQQPQDAVKNIKGLLDGFKR